MLSHRYILSPPRAHTSTAVPACQLFELFLKAFIIRLTGSINLAWKECLRASAPTQILDLTPHIEHHATCHLSFQRVLTHNLEAHLISHNELERRIISSHQIYMWERLMVPSKNIRWTVSLRLTMYHIFRTGNLFGCALLRSA